MTAPQAFTVGAFVLGGTDTARALVRHGELLAAYADGTIDDTREAYLSHFTYGAEMQRHFATNRGSVAEYAGPCGGRYLTLDIDRGDLAAALADARKLVAFLHQRYPDLEGAVPIYFSGSKGFHVLLEQAHRPLSLTFCKTAKGLAEAVAANAGVQLDTGIYFGNALIRLPNTRHPKTGLFKRRIDADALFRLDIAGIREHARHPAGDGLPSVRQPSEELAKDWHEAEDRAGRVADARAAIRRDNGTAPDARAPKYLVDLLRFGVEEGERHKTLFRCSAWLAEQGAPPSLCFSLLTEPGRDVGLTPADVDRQIRCGIEHADRQRAATAATPPPPVADAPPVATAVAAEPPPSTPPPALVPLADLERLARRAAWTWDDIRAHFDGKDDYVPHAGTVADLTGRQRAEVAALLAAKLNNGGAT